MTAGSDLFWSLRGEVACVEHAPERGSARWTAERWQRVPEFVFTDLRKRLQCQHCQEASGRPYRHERREATVAETGRHETANDDAATRELALLTAQIDNLRRDHDALLARVATNPDLAAVLRRVRDHIDSLKSLLDLLRHNTAAPRPRQ